MRRDGFWGNVGIGALLAVIFSLMGACSAQRGRINPNPPGNEDPTTIVIEETRPNRPQPPRQAEPDPVQRPPEKEIVYAEPEPIGREPEPAISRPPRILLRMNPPSKNRLLP